MDRSPLDRALALRTRLMDSHPIRVPAAWDAASAKILVGLGAELISVSSEAVATTLGKRRLESSDEAQWRSRVELVVRAVDVPVCVDLADGWGADPDTLADRAEHLLGAGAASVQLGDATGLGSKPLVEPELQVERIRAIRERANRFEHPLNLHAWTHAIAIDSGGRDADLEAITRGVRYGTAGAQSIGVAGALDHATVRRLVTDLEHPLGVMATPAIAHPPPPDTGELEEWGVRRIDLGADLLRSTLGLLRRAGTEFLERGNYQHLRGELRLGDARKALDSLDG